tara:strand:- start:299 stop:415 length:117 start_codon:yes stop_codon:yes gene_type:complete
MLPRLRRKVYDKFGFDKSKEVFEKQQMFNNYINCKENI